MKSFRVVGFVICLALLQSCIQRMVLKRINALDKYVELKTANNSKKEIVFIPIHHVGRKTYYDDVKRTTDSLRKLGYLFYYEGVKTRVEPDLLVRDTLYRKFRKLVGVDILSDKYSSGYIDTARQTIMGLYTRYISRYNLINQPPYTKLGIYATDVWADVYFEDIIINHESRFGKIELEPCDFATPFGIKYRCRKIKRKNSILSILEFRNRVIAEQVLKEPHGKIAIVYGRRHFAGLLKMLKEKDPAWRDQ